MELRWLRAFVAVVDKGGFARAADALFCSQSTISGQVASLERELGTVLFVRDRRPVQLTQAGQSFVDDSRKLLHDIEAAQERVSEVIGLKKGTVQLGTYSSATAGYLPAVLKGFRQRHPGVTVRLTDLGGAYLPEAALRGDVDIFLRQTMPPLSAGLFDSQILWQEDFKVVFRPEHELAQSRTAVLPETLLDHPLIITGKYHPDSLLAHPFWGSLAAKPSIAFEVAHPQSLIALVRENFGVGVTTDLALQISDHSGLLVRPLAAPAAVRDVALYSVKSRRLSPAAYALAQFMMHDALPPAGCTAPTSRE